MKGFGARGLFALTAFLAGLALAVVPTLGANVNVTAGGGMNTYNPKTVTVSEGDSVTWNNAGGFHNVKFEDGGFEQPTDPSSSAWQVSRTFTAGGTFRYYCEAHGGPGGAGMSGTVIVNPPLPFTTAALTLSAAAQDAGAPQVAVDPNGNAIFTWTRFDGTNTRVEARARSAAGTLSAVQLLSPAGQNATAPQVGVDSSGDAVFAWTRSDGTNTLIQARARSAAGTLSAVQTLSVAGQNAGAPQVAVDANGNAVFAWTRFDGTNTRVQARARSATGTLGAIQILSAAGQSASEPQIAVDPNGNAVFAWTRSDGTNTRIEGRARSTAGTLSAVQLLSTAGQNATEPEVGIDATGDAVFTWTRSNGTNTLIQARARSAAGTLSTPQTLSGTGQNAGAPQVAVDAGGDAMIVWGRFDGAHTLIQDRARTAAGTLSAVQTLSVAGQSATEPQVGIDSGGNAVFAWTRSDGVHTRIQDRARSAAGTLSAVQTISGAGQDAGAPQVAVDANRDSVAVWHRFDGTTQCGGLPGCDRIQGAAGP